MSVSFFQMSFLLQGVQNDQFLMQCASFKLESLEARQGVVEGSVSALQMQGERVQDFLSIANVRQEELESGQKEVKRVVENLENRQEVLEQRGEGNRGGYLSLLRNFFHSVKVLFSQSGEPEEGEPLKDRFLRAGKDFMNLLLPLPSLAWGGIKMGIHVFTIKIFS